MTLLAAPSFSVQSSEAMLWWQALLQTWSSSGQLKAAAFEALAPQTTSAGSRAFAGRIQALASQWQAGNFRNAPTIAFLSAEDLAGAKAAYASSTGTIYFNASWWESASEEEKAILLAEEVGHFLEDSTGLKDQAGDEGALFAAALFEQDLTAEERAAIAAENDSITISVDGQLLEAEAAAIDGTSFADTLIGTNEDDTHQRAGRERHDRRPGGQ